MQIITIRFDLIMPSYTPLINSNNKIKLVHCLHSLCKSNFNSHCLKETGTLTMIQSTQAVWLEEHSKEDKVTPGNLTPTAPTN